MSSESIVTLDENEVDEEIKQEKKEPTPLPKMRLFILCCICISESFSITMIFPFLAQMVLDFNLTTDPREIGFYAGWIASSFSLAQFCSSFMWGRISDRIGRRPVLLLGLGGNFLMVFLFGWSKELWFAILARSLNGFLNGNVAVARTYLSEITDDTNSSRGFSIFGLCWGFGLIIGPSIGGFLSNPVDKLPHIFPPGSFLHAYPYLLPCIASSLVTLVGFVLGVFFLKETKFVKIDDASEEKPLLSNKKNRGLEIDDNNNSKNDLKTVIKELFTTKEIIVTCTLYAILGFYKLMLDEIIAIWAPLSKDVGGLNFSSTDIGIYYAVNGAFGLVAQLFVYPIAVEKFGTLRMHSVASLLASVSLATTPILNYLVDTTWLMWLVLCILVMVASISFMFLFTTVLVLINNSSVPSKLGTTNGFAQTWTSLLRAVAPTLASNVFAWSVNNGYGFPLNHWFSFLCIGIFALICFGLTFTLDNSINHRKKEM